MKTTDTPSAYRDLVSLYGYHPVQAEQVIRTVLAAYDAGESPRDVSVRHGIPSSICYALSRWGDVR